MKNKRLKIGDRIGHLLITEIDESKPSGNGSHFYFMCECTCGKIMSMRSTSIRSRVDQECWHYNYEDLSGRVFNNVIVVCEDKMDTRYGRRRRTWKYKCLSCEKIKSTTGELLKRGAIYGCGECKRTGKDHPRYNPDADRFNDRGSTDSQKWAKAVMEIWDSKCIICGDSEKVNAHHLDGWHWCKEKRFDPDNGVVLCSGEDGCHRDFHSIYGNCNNTREQFEEYLNIHHDKSLDNIFECEMAV